VSRSGDDGRRHEPTGAAQRPQWLSQEQRERFEALGDARFRDAEFQRYAQSFRTHASLSEAGKLGWATTVTRHGSEFAWDRAADQRRAHPERASRDEQRMAALLETLGYDPQGRGYQREHKVAPRTHVDFGFPRVQKAIEVHGGVHFGPLFDADGRRAADDARKLAVIEAAGWQVLVITHDDLLAHQWEITRERARQFLEDQRPWRQRLGSLLRRDDEPRERQEEANQ